MFEYRLVGRDGRVAAKVAVMQVPQHLRYSSDHEWVSVDGTRASTANRRLTVFKRYFRWDFLLFEIQLKNCLA